MVVVIANCHFGNGFVNYPTEPRPVVHPQAKRHLRDPVLIHVDRTTPDINSMSAPSPSQRPGFAYSPLEAESFRLMWIDAASNGDVTCTIRQFPIEGRPEYFTLKNCTHSILLTRLATMILFTLLLMSRTFSRLDRSTPCHDFQLLLLGIRRDRQQSRKIISTDYSVLWRSLNDHKLRLTILT